MRWFTREWLEGRLPDDEWQRHMDEYAAHVQALRGAIPTDQRWLLDLDLHDAQVQSWSYADGQFAWVLLTGDLQRGYSLTSVRYLRAELTGVLPRELPGLLGHRSEVLYDEVAQTSSGLEQRFLVHPRGEFGVVFSNASMSQEPADASLRR